MPTPALSKAEHSRMTELPPAKIPVDPLRDAIRSEKRPFTLAPASMPRGPPAIESPVSHANIVGTSREGDSTQGARNSEECETVEVNRHVANLHQDSRLAGHACEAIGNKRTTHTG